MDIFFLTSKGSQLSVEVGYFDTILEIKEKILKYHGFPISRQTLVFNGQIMADDKDTDFYQLLQGSKIQLLLHDPDEPAPPASADEPTPTAQSSANSSASSDCDHVAIVGPRPYSGPPPPPPAANGAAAGNKKLKIMVQSKCGTKKVAMEVNGNGKVKELRKELQRLQHHLHFHLPHEGFFFIYKQNVMDEDQSFRWHDVRQGDVVEIFNGSVTGGS